MTVSAVSICSNALLQLGDAPISDFSENNDRTRLASNLWEMKRDKVLRSHPWNCAIKRVTLSPDTETPAFDWSYQTALPADCLRVLSVGLDGQPDDFAVEGRKLMTDTDTVYLRYIFRNTDVTTWDAVLIDAMSQVMKAAFAYAITKSTSKEGNDEQILRDVLKSARAVDGQEQTPDTLGDSPILANRMR